MLRGFKNSGPETTGDNAGVGPTRYGVRVKWARAQSNGKRMEQEVLYK